MQITQHLPHEVDPAKVFRRQEQLFAARAGTGDVEGRPNTLFSQTAAEMKFHVARALEFFEDYVIHTAAGVDQCGRQDRQTASFLVLAGRSEKPLWPFQGTGSDTTRHDL